MFSRSSPCQKVYQYTPQDLCKPDCYRQRVGDTNTNLSSLFMHQLAHPPLNNKIPLHKRCTFLTKSPHSSVGKESICDTGDPCSIPGLGRSLEKEMTAPSSLLAWRIPWTEEPGGLPSTELQRVRHDRVSTHG